MPQLTAIERRQDHIQRIRSQISSTPLAGVLPNDMPECHHYIGSSHNNPEDLMLFVRRNRDDPAVAVCYFVH